MHERALISKSAAELVSVVAGAPVSRVTLEVSPETNPAVVEQAWRSVTVGTSVADAALACVVRDHGLQCLECRAEYQGSKLTPCPGCGGNGLIVAPAPEVALGEWLVGEPV